MPRRQTLSAEKPVDTLAGEGDRTAVGLEDAGDHVEQRRLAGAVGADHAADLAGLDVERHLVHRHQAAEALGHVVEDKQRAHRPPPVSPSRRASHGQTPPGSATITMNRQTP